MGRVLEFIRVLTLISFLKAFAPGKDNVRKKGIKAKE